MLLMGAHHTKEQMIERQLDIIKSRATRYERGTAEQKYLLWDLEAIAREVDALRDILKSDKQDYYV